MTKPELESAIAEHNRIVEMLMFEDEDDLAKAVTETFFEAYADELDYFPECTILINQSSILISRVV